MSVQSRQSELSKIAVLTGISRGIGRTFLRDSKFFFTLYHAGKVNIILHTVSLSFLFYGLTEMGHAYNYFVVHNRDPRFGLRMIPYQSCMRL